MKSRRDPFELEDITKIRHAWDRAKSWEPVLNKEEIEEWVATNNLWEDTFVKFLV
jgi:hypothetical protein